MKKLLIFDLDGTLINTLIDLKNSVNYALNILNYPLRTTEQIRQAIGNGVAKLVARSLPGQENNKDYKEALKIFREYYSTHSTINTVPYEGVKETLINLKNEGYLLAVATNKLTSIARPLIEDFYKGLFDYVQGDEEGMDKKPAPMMIETICKKLNVNKVDAFYIGDTNIDMETAINSNVDYVLVTYGYRTKDELKVMCPNKPTIDDIKDLPNYLKSESI